MSEVEIYENGVELRAKVGVNIAEKSAVIWNIADMLRGLYKPHEYGNIIIPMTVIKRFNDCLKPTRESVWETYEQVKHFEVKDGFLRKASGYQFYNVSKYDFNTLVSDPNNIEENFRSYLAGFSENVQDILENFKFDTEIKTLADSGKLFYIIQEFNTQKADMSPEKITSVDMGYIFEDLIKRFSESYNEEAGAHFTSRDIIYTMVDLLVESEKVSLINDGVVKTVYDMAMGTSQMLGCMDERLTQFDEDAEVTSFGQEINPQTYAIAKADALIRGEDANNMRKGDTLADDKFSGYTFDFVISNPPFGIDWKSSKTAVEKEATMGDKGRFGMGLPSVSDGQMLFTLNGLSKLKYSGRMCIVHNGSPLFTGDAGSGPSEIRRYILEHDWLDAIVQLGTDMFYNTGITTYLWILDKDKPSYRAGKVQLIDASNCYEKRRKSIGNKRNDITDRARELIIKTYLEFDNKVYEDENLKTESKIFDTVDFGYNKIIIESPERDENGMIVLKKGKPVADSSLRDTENVPLTEDIDSYFDREVKPFNSDAWIDKSKTKVGYEIPFTRYFYKYVAPEKSEVIAERILEVEKELMASLRALFEKDGEKSE
jgi:type I restriction enzyme M protein